MTRKKDENGNKVIWLDEKKRCRASVIERVDIKGMAPLGKDNNKKGYRNCTSILSQRRKDLLQNG